MKYGLNLPNGGVCGDARTLTEFARLAEESGWDGVFLEDYIVYQGNQKIPTCDVWVALAAMAMETEKIRLGTEVTPLVRRRPWKVARETVTLDHLSGGRLTLGVGLGDTSVGIDFTHFGEVIDTAKRAETLDEALEVIVGLWSGKPFSHKGKYYDVKKVTLLPTPVQKPRIPIWIGGAYSRKGPMKRAARWDGSCLYRHPHHDLAPEQVGDLRAFVMKYRPSKSSFDIALGGRRRNSDWEKEKKWIESVADAGATWWMEWIPPGRQNTMKKCIERGPLRID